MIKSIIVARSTNQVIGREGKLPWHLSADMKHFKNITYGHHVIMGRKTFESLPGPLPNRKIIVVSRNPDYQAKDCKVAFDLRTALELAREAKETEVFVAGGAAVYQEALVWADKIYLTLVYAQVEGDTFFPELDNRQWIEIDKISNAADVRNPYAYDFIELVRSV